MPTPKPDQQQSERLSPKDRADLAKIASMLPPQDSRIGRIHDFLISDASVNLPAGVKVTGTNAKGGAIYGSKDAQSPSYWQALTNPVGSHGREQGIGGGALQVGGQAIKTMAQPLLHPIDTIKSAAKTAAYLGGRGFGVPMPEEWNPAEPIVEGFLADKDNGGLPLALENASGQALGTYEGGRIGGAAIDASKPALAATGRGLQRVSEANLDRIYPPSDSAILRGESSGRGILDSGIGPTLTRGSMVRKMANASRAVGSRIGTAVQRAEANGNAPGITSDQVSGAIERPLQRASARQQGFGGGGESQPLNTLRENLTHAAPGARGPIYGPNAPAEIPPVDLWRSIRNLDENTSYGRNPEIESINEVRRDIRGGLRPLLESADPTIKPLSSTYADLQTARASLGRTSPAFTPYMSLRGITRRILDSTPLNTTASSLGYRAGGMLRRIGGEASGNTLPGFSLKPIAKPLQLESDVPGNSAYGEDYSHGTIPPITPRVGQIPTLRRALAPQASPGDVQPMISGVFKHPGELRTFQPETTRIAPPQFLQPEQPLPMARTISPNGEIQPIPKGLLPAPEPGKPFDLAAYLKRNASRLTD